MVEELAQQWVTAILMNPAGAEEAAKRPNLSIDFNAFAAEIAVAQKVYDGLADTAAEAMNLPAGLDGRCVPTGRGGGGSVARPDARPMGRNLDGLWPMETHARQTWNLGTKLIDNCLTTSAAEHDGQAPTQLAFMLTGMAKFRHVGMMASQSLRSSRVRPT